MEKTIIIGGGLAGLTAAYYLQKANLPYLILEASDRVGGRVKTDSQDGFLMDRGFQVFLTAYPEAKAVLDYSALDLKAFDPGAILLRSGGRKGYIGDPLRQYTSLLPTVFTSAASFFDKVKILMTKSKLEQKSIEQIFNSKEFDTETLLKVSYGFSEQILSEFLRPFYAGIFLESGLTTSRRMFDFVFKMFAEGDATLPAKGMEEIPKQIASHLDPSMVKLRSKVSAISGNRVTLQDGNTLEGGKVLVATEATGIVAQIAAVKKAHRSTTNIYFTTGTRPFANKAIALLGTKTALVNNMTVLSNVSRAYAQQGHLISVSLKAGSRYKGPETHEQIRKELATYYPSTAEWKHLKTYQVDYALPDQTNIKNEGLMTVGDHIAVIGDHTLNGSINAAMKSGRLGAEWVLGG